MTDVHFVLMGSDRSGGMCLITGQTGIRAPLSVRETKPSGYRLNVKDSRFLFFFTKQLYEDK